MKRFRSRLLVIFAGLTGGVLIISLVAIWLASNAQISRTVERELAVSERVFLELLEQRAAQLSLAAVILADDFGFRQAIASDDQETIISALINHGERIGTDLMVLQDVIGNELAATHELATLPKLADLVAMGNEQGIAVIEGDTFQLITVPVRAPNLIGYLTLGFVIDESLTTQLQGLANADVTFYTADENKLLVSSLAIPQQQSFQEKLQDRSMTLSEWLVFQHLAGERIRLASLGETSLSVVLSTNLDEAGEEFIRLRLQYLGIAMVTLFIAMMLAVFTARRINRPLAELASAASRLRQGDYQHTIAVKGQDEFAQLGDTFDEMRLAIAAREQQIRYQLDHDALTDLPNRIYLQRYVTDTIERQDSGSLIFINLLRFRELNDALGQRIGDRVLREFSERLRDFSGQHKAVWAARIGGTEFALVIAANDGKTAALLSELKEAFIKPLPLSGSHYQLHMVCGSVEFPEHGENVDTLLRRAQLAATQAKIEREFTRAYEPGADEYHLRRLSILQALPMAIASETLQIYLQPKLACQSGEVVGAEVLLRWIHPELGFIGPDEFIPLAEKSGEIGTITQWVCQQAINLLANWNNQLHLAVNLSAVDLASDTLQKYLEQAIRDSAIIPAKLTLEVTESILMEDPEAAITRLEKLRSLGLTIAIDDYGTGYSSLAQLKRLPVNELKIDRSFIRDLDKNEQDLTIVRSTLELAHDFNLNVVAEGVETAAAWQRLKDFGCDELQGYHFSKPLPVADFLTWLQQYRGDFNEKN